MSIEVVAQTVTCTCWCEAEEVVIPVEFVGEGRTVPCDLPSCEPGCPTRAYDAFELEYEDEPEASELPVQMRKRITVTDYDPAADSSPGTAELRPAYGGLLLRQSETECECGCGTPRSSKARFRPGHDAKLKGKLQRALAADVDIHLVGPDGSVQHTNPTAVASHYGWSAIVDKGAERIRRRSATPVAAEKRLAKLVEDGRDDATLLKFGRWDKTGRAMAMWRLETGEVEIQYVTTDGTIEVFVPDKKEAS